MTPHNEAKKGEIAQKVIMTGDPLRVKSIALKYLENPKLVNQVRGMYAYTGEYKGEKITIMAHGMGLSSMGIYAYELYKIYDVEEIIRIGSAGTTNKNLKLFDVVLANKALTNSNFALIQNNEECYEVKANSQLNEKIKIVAKNINKKLIEGTINSTLVFDAYAIDKTSLTYHITETPLVSDMETFALFYLAQILNKKATCLLTVTDIIGENISATPEERQKSFETTIELALEGVISK